MQTRTRARLSLALAFALPLALGSSAGAADAASEAYKTVLARYAPTVVTVKLVLKIELQMGGQQQDQESRVETQGVVVDPSGLVLLSNSSMSSKRINEMLSGRGGRRNRNLKVQITPLDIKVQLDRKSEELDAFLVARDSALDLAFVQIDDLKGQTTQPVDFSKGRAPAVGDPIVSVMRLGKGFDYAAAFELSRIAGKLRKPRKAWILDGQLSGLGLPVYATDGVVVGILTTLSSGVRPESSGGRGGLRRLMGSRQSDSPIGTFVVPAKVTSRLCDQAKKKAVEVRAERVKQAAEEQAAEEKADAEKADAEKAKAGTPKPTEKKGQGEGEAPR